MLDGAVAAADLQPVGLGDGLGKIVVRAPRGLGQVATGLRQTAQEFDHQQKSA